MHYMYIRKEAGTVDINIPAKTQVKIYTLTI